MSVILANFGKYAISDCPFMFAVPLFVNNQQVSEVISKHRVSILYEWMFQQIRQTTYDKLYHRNDCYHLIQQFSHLNRPLDTLHMYFIVTNKIENIAEWCIAFQYEWQKCQRKDFQNINCRYFYFGKIVPRCSVWCKYYRGYSVRKSFTGQHI